MDESVWHTSFTYHHLAVELRRMLRAINIASFDAITWSGKENIKSSFIWNHCAVLLCHFLGFELYGIISVKKFSFILWLSLRNRPLTKERMVPFGFNVNPLCVFCQLEIENAEHLFCTCSFTSQIIHSCPSQLTGSWSDFLQEYFFVRPNKKVKTLVSFLFLAGCCALHFVGNKLQAPHLCNPEKILG